MGGLRPWEQNPPLRQVVEAESERARLQTAVAAQRELHQKWWQHHLAQLPQYCKQMEDVKMAEMAVPHIAQRGNMAPSRRKSRICFLGREFWGFDQ